MNFGSEPQLVGALGRDPKGACSGERTAAISAAVAEKIAFEIFFQRHLAATPSIAATPFRVHGVSTSRPTSCENFATIRPRVRTSFDFFEISKCPTTEVHDIETAFIHARASGKSKSDGVE